MGSIVKRSDGYRAHVYVEGHRASRIFRTRKEADAWIETKEAEFKGGGANVTFTAASEQWLDLKLPMLDNEANKRTVEQSIRDHVLPTIGAKKIRELTRADLVGIVTAVAKAGRVETAHRIGQRIKSILDLQIDSGVITSHPGADLARVLPKRRKKRMPAIKIDELPQLLKAIDYFPFPTTRLGLLLLAHTFVRTQELLHAQRDEIRDADTWVIPEERMKGKAEDRKLHVVPLSRQVRGYLEDARILAPESTYFLGSEVNPMCGLSTNTLLFALYSLGYKGRMTGHGFRSIASSVLNESRLWHPDAIERQLHHDETDAVRAAYHRAEYLDERRRMCQWYSDHLDSLYLDRSRAARTDS
jgi:integrase